MRTLLIAALALIAPFAKAQTVALPDTVVVTATREPIDLRQSGRRVTVITSEHLRTLPAASLDELLRSAAGVEMFSRGPFGVQSDFTVRGSSFSGVILLLDGVRLSDPQTAHFLSDLPVSLAEIARIEVLRGPAAALYGPDAVGGVIHIQTWAGLGAQEGGSALVAGGMHGLLRSEATSRFRLGAFTLTPAFHASQATGDNIPDLQGNPGDAHAGFERAHGSVSLHAPLTQGTVFARLAADARAFDAVRFYTDFAVDSAYEKTRTGWLQVQYATHATSRTRLIAQGSARVHTDRYTFNRRTPTNTHTNRQASAMVAVYHDVSPALRLGAGLSGEVRNIDSNNMGEHRDAGFGVFSDARLHFTPALTASGSLRYDRDPGFGTALTPQVALAWTQPRFTVRSALGRAVRAPSYTERYFNTTLARPRGRNLGNPALRAERAWNVEAGLDLYPAPSLTFHGTLFSRRTTDLIDFARLSPADTVFLARNLLRTSARGSELEVRWHPAHRKVAVDLAYTRFDARLGAVSDSVTLKYALAAARSMLQAHARANAGPVQVSVQSLWRQPRTGNAYHVHHVRTTAHLPRTGWRAFIEVRNVFDAAYIEVFAPQPGRWVLGGIQASW